MKRRQDQDRPDGAVMTANREFEAGFATGIPTHFAFLESDFGYSLATMSQHRIIATGPDFLIRFYLSDD